MKPRIIVTGTDHDVEIVVLGLRGWMFRVQQAIEVGRMLRPGACTARVLVHDVGGAAIEIGFEVVGLSAATVHEWIAARFPECSWVRGDHLASGIFVAFGTAT